MNTISKHDSSSLAAPSGSLVATKPFDVYDPSWISEFSDIYIHPLNHEFLVSIWFPMEFGSLCQSFFFGAEVHRDYRFPRYNKRWDGSQWVDDVSSMAILGIRRGESFAAENERIRGEVAGYLALPPVSPKRLNQRNMI